MAIHPTRSHGARSAFLDEEPRGGRRLFRRRRGARSATAAEGTRRKRGAGLLIPIVLGLLLLAAAAFLIPKLADDDKSSSSGAKPAKKADPAPAAAAAGGLPAFESLRSRIGDTVSADKVTVQKVGEQGFWVGKSQDERAYVEFGAKTGENEAGASSYQPKVGDPVSMSAEVRPAPEQPGRTFHIPVADEKIVQQQGFYLNAKSVEPAR